MVSLGINIGAMAASAEPGASDTGAGAQTGDYVLDDVNVTVGGTVLAPVLNALQTPLGVLVGLSTALRHRSVTNPLAGGQIVVTEDALTRSRRRSPT